jgi:hypothetical protein
MLSRAILGYNVGGGGGVAPYAPLNFSSNYNNANYINFGQFPQSEIQAATAKTIGVWMKRLDVVAPPASQTLISREDTTAGPFGGNAGWSLFYTANQRLAFRLHDDSTGSYIADISTFVSPPLATDLAWHLAMVTKSTATDWTSLNLYWDGAPTGHSPSGAGALAAIPYAGWDLCVGSTSNQQLKADLALMCHSFIIDGELTPAEVAELYSLTKPVDLTTASFPGSIDHWCTAGDGCNIGAGACPDLSPLLNPGTALGGMTLPDLEIADVPP